MLEFKSKICGNNKQLLAAWDKKVGNLTGGRKDHDLRGDQIQSLAKVMEKALASQPQPQQAAAPAQQQPGATPGKSAAQLKNDARVKEHNFNYQMKAMSKVSYYIDDVSVEENQPEGLEQMGAYSDDVQTPGGPAEPVVEQQVEGAQVEGAQVEAPAVGQTHGGPDPQQDVEQKADLPEPGSQAQVAHDQAVAKRIASQEGGAYKATSGALPAST